MKVAKKLHLALCSISKGFSYIDSREVRCGSEHAFHLPTGKCARDIEPRLDTLAAAVGAPVEIIDRLGGVVIRVVKYDFPKYLQYDPAHLKNDKILIGYDRIFNPQYVNLMHLLIGGAANSGKTMLIRFMLYQLIKMGAIIKIIDMKGYSFLPFEPFSNVSVAKNLEQAAETLAAALNELDDRMQMILQERNRSLTKTLPPYVVLIDEAGQIAPSAYPKGSEDRAFAAYCDLACGRLAQVGRESRVLLFYCTQKPSRDIVNGQVRANVESMIGFRTNNHYESEIIVGEPGCERISPNTAGRALFKYDRKHIMQVPYIGEEDEDWEKLLNPLLAPEVIKVGTSHRSEPQRKYIDGVISRADSDFKAASVPQPKPGSAKESVKAAKRAGKRKANQRHVPPSREDMVSNAKRQNAAASYADEISDED